MRIALGGDMITFPQPDNFHAHFRQGDLAKCMVGLFESQGFGRVLAMPNLRPPVLNHQMADDYRRFLIGCRSGSRGQGQGDLQFVMTMQITEETTPAMIEEAASVEIVMAGKIYPKDMTTHSENGVSLEGYTKLYPVFETAEKLGFRILFHGESPSPKISGLQKELYFLDILRIIVEKFPRLKIVLEHITTAAAVEFIESVNRHSVCATITVHHLDLVLDDVIGYSAKGGYLMRPHNMCKPVAKFAEDRKALIGAATSGLPCFFYGGDDAPHDISLKHCDGVCAGVFNTLEAIPMLVDLFENMGVIDRLEGFMSTFGAQFYGLPINQGEISLLREAWQVPETVSYGGDAKLRPWRAGQFLPWKIIPAS